MKISFGAALPVGVGSTCEIFDIYLTRYVAPDAALDALRAACVPDLMVQSCSYVDNKAAAASLAHPVSTYEVIFDRDVAEIEVPISVEVVRKRKQKTLVVSDFLVQPFAVEGKRATFSLEAKETGSLRPDVLLAHCKVDAKIVSVTRIAQRS